MDRVRRLQFLRSLLQASETEPEGDESYLSFMTINLRQTECAQALWRMYEIALGDCSHKLMPLLDQEFSSQRKKWEQAVQPCILPNPPRTVDERFRAYCSQHGLEILRCLQTGTGGFTEPSSVFLVRDTDQIVKVFKEIVEPEQGVPENELASFERLQGVEGLPRLYGVEEVGDGLRFMRLEYCYGQSLADMLQRDRPFEPVHACALISRLSSILQRLHERGMLYLDLRPENIKVDGRDLWLLDLGDACPINDGGSVFTYVHDIRYVPPEVGLFSRATTASDIFQLGVLLHELLTGQHPFLPRELGRQGDEVTALRYVLTHALIPWEERVFEELSPNQSLMLNRMLASDPLLRPTAAEVTDCFAEKSQTRTIPYISRRKIKESLGRIVFPARMGVPHRGHIDFMSRLLELGYDLLVSVQHSYRICSTDPIPKPLVVKMVAQSLLLKGFDLERVRFMCTPYFATAEQHRLFFQFLLEDMPDLVAVASGNPKVPELFGKRLPVFDQSMVFGREGEAYVQRSWGEQLRRALRNDDVAVYQDLLAPGADRILSYAEMRQACSSYKRLEHVWGHEHWGQVFAVVKAGGAVLKKRVLAYSTPEDVIFASLERAEWVDRFARESLLMVHDRLYRLVYERVEMDEMNNQLIHYSLLPVGACP